jgi:hypothetical protein
VPTADEQYLEKLTNYALNSRIVPLGTMNDELREETVIAINGWLRVGGGFALDSAGRLLHRLDAEYAILNPFSVSFHKRSGTILDLHRLLFQSWMDVYSNHRQSKLALLKAGDTLQRLITRQADKSGVFPIDDFLTIIDGCVIHATYDASRNAARLLICATDHTREFEKDMSPYFDIVHTKLLESNNEPNNDDIHDALLQRMEFLHDTVGWHAINLPAPPLKEMKSEDEKQQTVIDQPKTPESGSDYFRERLIKAINNAADDKKAKVEKLSSKLFDENGQDSKVVESLIDFYVRVQDTKKSSHWIHTQLRHWELFSDIEKQKLAKQATKLSVLEGNVTSLVQKVLGRLKEDDLRLSESFSTSVFQEMSVNASNPKLVLELMKSLENLEECINLPLYKSVVQMLFKFEKKALDDIDVVYSQVLSKVKKNPSVVTPEAFSDFLYGLLAMYTYRNLFNEAGECLRRAEKTLLSTTPKDGEISMISLDCYERMIQRKWYTKKTAPRVESTFQRLMDFYLSGYSNLRPNQKIFAAHMKARATTTSDAAEVEKVLDEMLDLYETTGDDSCKPNTEIFNSVLLAYRQDAKKASAAGQKSISLLDKMQSLHIQPDTKSLNYVMQSVNKSTKNDVYLKVCEIFGMFDTYELEPDTFSRHLLLDACGSAGPKNSNAALMEALETFGDIRKQEQIGPLTYPILTKVLQRILPKGDRTDKAATSAFLLCCEDGLLEQGQLKKRFKSLTSKATWHELYTGKLHSGKQEPHEWSRNLS